MNSIAIVAPSFRETSGGRLALHRLCDHLLRQNIPAYLVPWKDPASSFATARGYLSRVRENPAPDDIVVYPDIITGNPFGARRVVRWYLYHPRAQPRREDRCFSYMPDFGGYPILRVSDPRLDVFQPRDYGPREGFCWTWRKASRQGWPDTAKPTEGTELPKRATLADLAAAFNTHERFMTFDNATFMAIQARLCGCEVIVRSKTPLMPRLAELIRLDPATLRTRLFAENADEMEAAKNWGEEILRWA